MHRRSRRLVQFLVVVSLFLQPLLPAGVALSQVQEGATLTVLRGEVAVVRPDGSAVQPAPTGTTVNAGDEIRTLTRTGALITFFAGTEIEMGEQTILVVERVSRDGAKIDISLKQVLGSTLNRVQSLSDPNSSYRIDAGGATSLVRGTTFLLIGPVATSQGNIAALVCLDDCDGRTTFAACPVSPYTAFGVTVERGRTTSGCDTAAVSRGSDYFNAGAEAITTFEQSFASGNGVDNPGGTNLGREEGQRHADERNANEHEEDKPNAVLSTCAVGGGVSPGTPGSPSLFALPGSAIEGDSGTTPLVVPVILAPPASGTVTVNFTTSGLTATPGVDFTPVSGTLTFPAGSTVQNVVIPVVGDTSAESNELIRVTLSNASGATISNPTGVGTIVDDDGPVTITATGASVFEGNSGTQALPFSVLLDHPSGGPVTVNYTTTSAGTATPGTDFTSTSGSVTIPAGQTSGSFSIPVVGDPAVEPNETVVVQLSTSGSATVATPSVTGTIVDDDGPATIAVFGASTHEGCDGHTPLDFEVDLSHPLSTPVTVNFATANGTATVGQDYDAASGTLTFAPGETHKDITVQVIGDQSAEPDETIILNLSNPSGASLSSSRATGIILNDD